MESLRAEIEKGWWQSLLKILQDSFVIVPKASLPTKEKEALKKAFGAFNTGFEQVGSADVAMIVPHGCHRCLRGLRRGWRVLNLLVFQVFTELKQMTIPSAALRADVVAAIGDQVVRTCSFCVYSFARALRCGLNATRSLLMCLGAGLHSVLQQVCPYGLFEEEGHVSRDAIHFPF